MKSLRSRIILFFVLLMACSVVLTGIFVALLLYSSYLDSLTDRLLKEGDLLAKQINWEEVKRHPERFNWETRFYRDSLNVNLSFITSEGKIIGHQPVSKKVMLQFPEIKNALRSSNQSPVIEKREGYLFAGIPIRKEGRFLGVIHIELNIEEVDDSLNRVWFSLIGGLLIAFVLAGLASSKIAVRVTRPLEEMTQVALDITKKRFYRRVRGRGDDEVARLGQAINRMAHHLQHQMNTIRQSEHRLKSVIGTLESGLLMIDATGMVRLANRSFTEIFGLRGEELSGKMYTELTTPPALQEWIAHCMQEEQKMRTEMTIIHPQKHILEVVLTPMWLDQEGVSVVVMIHDLTTVRKLEKMRKDFVANVSHELKTPITSIRGFAETLLDETDVDAETEREFLQIILDESIRIQRLVGDLLDLSSIESKKNMENMEWASIKHLLNAVVKTIDKQAKNRQQTLTVHLEEDFSVYLDIDGFQQILINLLSNAVTYTPEGGQITVIAKKRTDDWQLMVADTGIGIPEKDIGRIFERFYRVSKDRSRESGGTGLGLAIVKHLIEAHNGQIQVESEIGKGSCFTITFPLPG
jgi:two-component system phosphate regulon sensor histidine kinase PhoR